jgi:hypothetical protein
MDGLLCGPFRDFDLFGEIKEKLCWTQMDADFQD